jgi:thioredoxin reductase (NADPH)
LLVAWGDWGDRATAKAILDAMALGRIDYFLLRPAASPDELFHQAISSFLLEWSEARHIAPQTIRVVGETWAGRAHELRNALERCAIPHAFYRSESREGRDVLANLGSEVKLPVMDAV